MKKTAAWLVRHALEQIGIQYTFGIPGVHNIELYDELRESDSILPMLVTHEGGAAFMADAVSRVRSRISCRIFVAIQVAEAFQRYASHIKGFHVLPVYGGQDYAGQIRQLKRGVHVVAVMEKTPAEEAGVEVDDLIVGIDGRELQGRPTGTGRYLRNLLRRWRETGDEPEVAAAEGAGEVGAAVGDQSIKKDLFFLPLCVCCIR